MKCVHSCGGTLGILAIFSIFSMQDHEYHENEKVIPLQGYNFALRFAALAKIETLIEHTKLFSQYNFSDSDADLYSMPSCCGCVQIPASGQTLDLLFEMTTLPHDQDVLRKFLRDHSWSFDLMMHALGTLSVLYKRGICEQAQVVIHHKPESIVSSWEPSTYVPLFGKVKTKLICVNPNLSLILVQHCRREDGNVGRLIVVKDGCAIIKSYSTYNLEELNLLIKLACIADPVQFSLLETYPYINPTDLKQLILESDALGLSAARIMHEICEG